MNTTSKTRDEATYNTELHAAYAAGDFELAHAMEREHLEREQAQA